MNLWRIRTEVMGKGYDIPAFLEYVVATDEMLVEDYVNRKYKAGKWFDDPDRDAEELKWDVLAQNGNFHWPNDGDPDQKFGWTEPKTISREESVTLVKLGIAVILDHGDPGSVTITSIQDGDPCPSCNHGEEGFRGQVWSFGIIPGPPSWITCPTCKGSGVQPVKV